MLISIGDDACCSVSQPYVEWVKRGCRDVVSATQEDFMSNLWHRQLAHRSEKRLQILAKKSLIPFAKVMSLKSCDYCSFGKQHFTWPLLESPMC